MGGMRKPTHIETLISNWPTRREFAQDVGAAVEAVHKWAQTGRIPSSKQKAVLDAASARGIAYATAEWMVEIHSKQEVA